MLMQENECSCYTAERLCVNKHLVTAYYEKEFFKKLVYLDAQTLWP